ncbi:hypothetical protein TRICI_003181 [Trichomonascus ciferrii]|uniref:Uncharacterized protein n=1 Tax=Trichomonascus ciferrii TaxID=44093 RepID=A0A642V3Y4_9ASCO|nr:hypothetical protein TRICI_003181 [Trichomonascus ciferrii]
MAIKNKLVALKETFIEVRNQEEKSTGGNRIYDLDEGSFEQRKEAQCPAYAKFKQLYDSSNPEAPLGRPILDHSLSNSLLYQPGAGRITTASEFDTGRTRTKKRKRNQLDEFLTKHMEAVMESTTLKNDTIRRAIDKVHKVKLRQLENEIGYRTKELELRKMEAEVRKMEAEARKMEAEVRKTEAGVRKMEAEVRKMKAESRIKSLDMEAKMGEILTGKMCAAIDAGNLDDAERITNIYVKLMSIS